MCGEDFLPLCHDSSEWEIKLMDPEDRSGKAVGLLKEQAEDMNYTKGCERQSRYPPP